MTAARFRAGAAGVLAALLFASACGSTEPQSAALPFPATETADPPTASAGLAAPTTGDITSAGEPGRPDPTPTVSPVHESTPVAAPTVTATPTPSPTPAPVGWIAGACAAPPMAQPDDQRPHYEAHLVIDPQQRTVSGHVDVTFIPDLAVENIVFRLWPNGPREAAAGASMQVASIAVDGAPVEVAAGTDRSLVTIALGDVVDVGTLLHISMDFELQVGGPGKARVASGDGWMRLGSILPLLAWEPGVGWATEPGTALFAEAVTSPTADWVVHVDVPEDVDVLATGEVTDVTPVAGQDPLEPGWVRQLWQADAVRDFALSVGRFDIVERTVKAPDDVLVRVGVHSSVGEDASAYLQRIELALVDFSLRYGAYPWPTLTTAVTPGIGGGIEFPTHIMLGEGTIGRTTPHEVGHMFFYSLVGNNQARDPWIDEGLASWAEFVHEGRDPLSLGVAVSGRSGQPMGWFAGRSDYYTSVYQQPAMALAGLGSVAEVDCALRILVARHAFGIATTADVLDALAAVFGDVDAAFASYGITR